MGLIYYCYIKKHRKRDGDNTKMLAIAMRDLLNFSNKHVCVFIFHYQPRIIGAVRGAHSHLWRTTIHVCSPYIPRKYDKRFDTPAIVMYREKLGVNAERLIYREKECLYTERNGHFSY